MLNTTRHFINITLDYEKVEILQINDAHNITVNIYTNESGMRQRFYYGSDSIHITYPDFNLEKTTGIQFN